MNQNIIWNLLTNANENTFNAKANYVTIILLVKLVTILLVIFKHF